MNKNYSTSITPVKTIKIYCFLLVAFFSISFSSYGQDVKNHSFTTPGSRTLEVPAGVGDGDNVLTVQTWGAGGGGGGTTGLIKVLFLNVTVLSAGGGGGGGAYSKGIVSNVGVDEDNVKIPYIIGAGGVSNSPGGATSFSAVSSIVSANGGLGGSNGTLLSIYGNGGAGGVGSPGGFSGGNGYDAGLLGIGLVSGSGGGGAGSGGAGFGGTPGLLSNEGGNGGAAANNDGGAGGSGGDGLLGSVLELLGNGNGNPGVDPGGGGGGGAVLAGLGANVRGGKGGDGQIKITYTCPTYTVDNVTADDVCVGGATTVTLNGFLPIGKYTVTYHIDSPSQTLQAVDVKVRTPGTLKFTVGSLNTLGTIRITINSIRSVDCETTNINKFKNIIVSPNLTAAVSIATPPTSGGICYGTAVTFTATPTNEGTNPVYQWKVNGVNVVNANSDGKIYTNSTLRNGDIVSCVMTSNATPCLTGNPATSNSITMAVSGPAANPVTVCVGNSGSLTASVCSAGVTITKNAGTRVNVAKTGSTLDWTISGAVASDGRLGASSKLTIGGLLAGGGTFKTNYLQAKNFDFSEIPPNAIIKGIQVSIVRYSSNSNGSTRYVRDNVVSLMKDGNIVGVNKAVTNSNWPTTAAATDPPYGGTSDLWSETETWTPAEIKSSGFGVAIAADIRAPGVVIGSETTTASVDYISVTVTYDIPVNWYTADGTLIGSGNSFNPVGVANSGLANTNTPGKHTFYAACSTAPTCRTPVDFIINGVPVITAIATPAPLCSGGVLNPAIPAVTTNSPVNPTAGWEISTTSANSDYTALTVPYTVSVADNAKYIRYYVSNGGCITTYSNAVPITVKSIPEPTIGALTPPICTLPTASVVVNGLVGDWTVNATPSIGLSGLSGTGTFATIKGLTPGTTYSFTVSNGSCTSPEFTVEVEELATRIWKDGLWVDETSPTIDEKVIFESDYDKKESVTACSCEVKSGAVVVFNSGYYLKLRNELIVDPNAVLTFENDASLVQMNDAAVNLGSIYYNRSTTAVNRYDYTYWSSPVSGMTLYGLSPLTFYDKYYSYNSDGGKWEVNRNGTLAMEKGEGYIVRAPQIIPISGNPSIYPAVFKGVPYNGEVKKTLTGGKLYLLGNPYPSGISAEAFLIANATKLQGTLYFWTHNSPPSDKIDGDKKYNYTANDYATYNRTGGTATAIKDPEFNYTDINSNIPNGTITATQGFFAPASAAGGEIVFNNNMRLTDDEIEDDEFVDDEVRNNSQFFKLDTGKNATTTTEKSRIWLNLTNKEGAFKQTLVGYISGATNDYEGSFDGVSYDGNAYVDFYSVNNEKNLTIQGRALPFVKKDSVALGYKSTISGEFQISIDQTDGVLASQSIFVEDKLTQVLHDLKTPYSFTTEIGTFNNRFVLRYEDKNAIIEDIDTPLTAVSVSTKDKSIKLKTTDSVIDKVYIYDFSGGLVYSDSEINATTTIISNLLVDHSALIVHVVLENGKKTIKKIMY